MILLLFLGGQVSQRALKGLMKGLMITLGFIEAIICNCFNGYTLLVICFCNEHNKQQIKPFRCIGACTTLMSTLFALPTKVHVLTHNEVLYLLPHDCRLRSCCNMYQATVAVSTQHVQKFLPQTCSSNASWDGKFIQFSPPIP